MKDETKGGRKGVSAWEVFLFLHEAHSSKGPAPVNSDKWLKFPHHFCYLCTNLSGENCEMSGE